MGLKKLFLITVLAGAMSVLGCGDDETNGTGNTGGEGATGGAGATGGDGGSGGSAATGGGGGAGGSASGFCADDCADQSKISACETAYDLCDHIDPDVCKVAGLEACDLE